MIEFDQAAGAVYVRFSSDKVARTVPSSDPRVVINVDLNANRDVVGIEAIGFSGMSIEAILQVAKVESLGFDAAKA